MRSKHLYRISFAYCALTTVTVYFWQNNKAINRIKLVMYDGFGLILPQWSYKGHWWEPCSLHGLHLQCIGVHEQQFLIVCFAKTDEKTFYIHFKRIKTVCIMNELSHS